METVLKVPKLSADGYNTEVIFQDKNNGCKYLGEWDMNNNPYEEV